jgi:hypothetical protein
MPSHTFSKKEKEKKKGRAIPNMPMGYGMGYGLASYRQLLAIAAVSTERFAILLATTDEREALSSTPKSKKSLRFLVYTSVYV